MINSTPFKTSFFFCTVCTVSRMSVIKFKIQYNSLGLKNSQIKSDDYMLFKLYNKQYSFKFFHSNINKFYLAFFYVQE